MDISSCYYLHPDAIRQTVAQALAEDLGSGDVSVALLPNTTAKASVIAKSAGICCGRAWFEESFRQLDPSCQFEWEVHDGQQVAPQSTLVTIRASLHALLSAERTALNFLQTLSGTATATHSFVQQLAPFKAKLLDTRKTLPGLRYAQKYAVRCGGAENHRLGLFDAVMLKENHIAAAGSLSRAIELALSVGKPVIVEVQTLEELRAAIAYPITRALLDNFSLAEVEQAVALNQGRCPLEVSGNVSQSTLIEIAQLGVDFISVGMITKHLQAMDLSLLLES